MAKREGLKRERERDHYVVRSLGSSFRRKAPLIQSIGIPLVGASNPAGTGREWRT